MKRITIVLAEAEYEYLKDLVSERDYYATKIWQDAEDAHLCGYKEGAGDMAELMLNGLIEVM